jgi:hypothetical protein
MLGARRLVALGRPALPRRRQPCWGGSPGGAREPRSGPKTAPPQDNDPAPVTGTLTGPRPPLRVSKAAGCPEVQPPLPHAGAAGPGRRQPGALLLQSGQTLLANGAGRVIGGLHMKLAALRGASDGDGRPGGADRDRMHCAAQKCSCRSSASRLGAPVSRAGHASGRTQITPFGRGTGGHAGGQVAFHIGGSAFVLPVLLHH